MATNQHGRTAPAAVEVTAWIPPLEQGDRLSREEFERRYRAMPQLKKASFLMESFTCRLPPVSSDIRLLVVEVASSSVSYDLGPKLDLPPQRRP